MLEDTRLVLALLLLFSQLLLLSAEVEHPSSVTSGVLETVLRSMAERLRHGDEYSARRLLRAALRCSSEHTLLALRVPSGIPEPRTATRGWRQRQLKELGASITEAMQEAARVHEKGNSALRWLATQGEEPWTQGEETLPALPRLIAVLFRAGHVAAAAEWAHLVMAAETEALGTNQRAQARSSVASSAFRTSSYTSTSRSAFTSRSVFVPLTASAPSSDFQQALPLLLHDDEMKSAYEAAKLLCTVAHKRLGALTVGDWNGAYDAFVVEARVCMLKQQFAPGILALQRAARLPSRQSDAQLVCLEVSAHEAILNWQTRSPSPCTCTGSGASSCYSTEEYLKRYEQLARTLSALASGTGPPPSQCIAPFATLVSPLPPALILMVASSAAHKEQHMNSAQSLVRWKHPDFGFLYHETTHSKSASSTSTHTKSSTPHTGPYALRPSAAGIYVFT
jgi:hypothetical protein